MSGPVKVGLAGLAIGIGLAVRLLAPAGWDVSVIGAFGEQAEQTSYARQVLGRHVVTRPELGHDGRFFFIQANDPWYAAPQEHAVWLDRPLYRAQRMVYPVLASAGGLAGPEAVLWGMLAVNVLAMGIGAGLGGVLASSHGAAPWWGLAFPLNVGLINEFGIGGAGIVAFAAAVAGVLLLERGRGLAAGVALALAVLAREAMLLFVAGLLAYDLLHRRRVTLPVLITPVAVATAWAGFIRLRLPGGSGVDQIEEIGMPFVGLVQAAQWWDLTDWVVVVAWVAISAGLVIRAVRRPCYLAWGSAGFVGLALVFTRQVWINFYDVTRATAPVLTAWVFAAFVRGEAGHPSGGGD
jgi:hypothetical protein